MAWQAVGAAVAGPDRVEISAGLTSVPLDDGYLKLRIRTVAPADPVPLSFLIVRPVAAVEGGGVPEGRYYPNSTPTVLALGPGVGEDFTGELRLKIRRYNLRWLEAKHPASSITVAVDVWAPAPLPMPSWLPGGFSDGLSRFVPAAQTGGQQLPAPLTHA